MVVNHEQILSYNLKKLGIVPEGLYKFLEKLGDLPFIGNYILDITTNPPGIIAEYTGGLKISCSCSREAGDREPIPPEVTKNLHEILDSMPAVKGVTLRQFYPSLRDDDECYGKLFTNEKGMIITLKRRGQ